MNTRLYSFPPIANPEARILILGSMPGEASLKAQQYYAHPRNLFWPIMGALIGAGPELPYPQLVAKLQENGIALWDVLQSCVRKGSLDSSIQQETPQDFAAFFMEHPKLTHVFFNGGKAQQSFRRHVAKDWPGMEFSLLPSTSPAHAARSFDEKLQIWSRILEA